MLTATHPPSDDPGLADTGSYAASMRKKKTFGMPIIQLPPGIGIQTAWNNWSRHFSPPEIN